MKRFTADVKEDPETGDTILEFPADLLAETGWKEGDILNWKENKDGSFTLTKKENTEYVLVETVSTFRNRYVVEVPAGKSKWALDTVTCNDGQQFSSTFIDESIFSDRVISMNEAIELCDIDNDYAKSWTQEHKIETFFTSWKNNGKS